MRLNRVLVRGLQEVAGLSETARGGGTGESGGTVVLRGPEAHHLRDVLRLGVGAPVEAFDGLGNVARGEVSRADRDGVALRLGPLERSRSEAGLRLTVAVALLKGDKLSDVVRQCTELGASGFVLTLTRQADVGELSAAKLQRLQRVAQEAARQCGRATVPEIGGPSALAELTWSGAAFIADPRASVPLQDAAAATGHGGEALVLTGPEGGFTAAEVEGLVARGAVAVNLGPR
ncbi:MAG TPA: RsmE family RNA methyltransferase, partial [Trueperaceae bacterium]|nr:RsmE family RNA methyltransferase [Trueperaceae bacterium]